MLMTVVALTGHQLLAEIGRLQLQMCGALIASSRSAGKWPAVRLRKVLFSNGTSQLWTRHC